MVGKFGLCKDMCQTSWQHIFYYSNVMEFMSVWVGNKWFRVCTLQRGLATNDDLTFISYLKQMLRCVRVATNGKVYTLC